MARRPKGFDPLSSLFLKSRTESPSDMDLEEESSSHHSIFPVVEHTDPFFSGPVGEPRAPSARSAPERRREPSDATARSEAERARSAEPEPSAPPSPELLEAPEARYFRGGDAQPDAPPAPVEDTEPLVDIQDTPDPVAPEQPGSTPASEDPHPNFDPSPDPGSDPNAGTPPPEQDPASLARALGRAAAAKAGPPQRSRTAAPTDQEPTSSSSDLSRAEKLSQRARRTRRASDVISEARRMERQELDRGHRRREASNRAHQATPTSQEGSEGPPARHVVRVQELLQHNLRGVGPIEVRNVMSIENREVFRALWRAHRARFAADGALEKVVGAAAVLWALDQVPSGCLAAAHVLTEASDYLVWVDLRRGTPVAAFADAKAYFVGGTD